MEDYAATWLPYVIGFDFNSPYLSKIINMKPNQLLCVLFAGMLLFGCKSKQAKTNATQQQVSKVKIEIIDPEALSVLDSSATIETIAKGRKWTEGPLYIKDGDYFIFSDIPENKIYIWKEGQGLTTYLTPSGKYQPCYKSKRARL